MIWVAIGLVAGAVAVLVAAEWPRLDARFGVGARRRRERERRKASFTVVQGDAEVDDFAASVQRDLDRLPTYEPPRDRK